MSLADDDDLPPLSPEEEATLQEEIELALEPYRKLAPPSLLPVLRESLERSLRGHPAARQLLRGFAPIGVDIRSGSRPRPSLDVAPPKAGGKEGA